MIEENDEEVNVDPNKINISEPNDTQSENFGFQFSGIYLIFYKLSYKFNYFFKDNNISEEIIISDLENELNDTTFNEIIKSF